MGTIGAISAICSAAFRIALAHRTNTVFHLLVALVNTGTGLAVVAVLYSQSTAIAGWRAAETVVLFGTFQVVSSFLAAFVEPNFGWFKERVLRGELDDHLLKPLPILASVSTQRFAPMALFQGVLGIAIVVVGAMRGGPVTYVGAASWFALVIAAMIVTWATRVAAAGTVFWLPHFEPSFLYHGLWQLGRYPVAVYGTGGRLLLTWVLPAAVIGTLPASALFGRERGWSLVAALATCSATVTLATLVWRRGLRRYTSATS